MFDLLLNDMIRYPIYSIKFYRNIEKYDNGSSIIDVTWQTDVMS